MEEHQNIGIHFLYSSKEKDGSCCSAEAVQIFFLFQLQKHTVKINNAHRHSLASRDTGTQTHPSAAATQKEITGT